jgi:hypothetical protein
MFCQNCGAQIAGEFCTNCGVRGGQTPAVAAPPPAPSTPAPPSAPPPATGASNASLEQLGNAAHQFGAEAVKVAQQGIGAQAARMGAISLGAGVVLVIAWFFLAAGIVTVTGGPLTFTFWSLLSRNYETPGTMWGGAANYGLFAALGLVSIAAPFAAPYIRMGWAKYLNAAPLAFFPIAILWITISVHKALQVITSLGVPNPFSWNWIVLAVVLAAELVLARGALAKPGNA